MNASPRSLAIFLTILFTFLLVLSPRASTAPPQIAGTYKITENTDLGSEIRITLQINLINPGGTQVTITKVGLRSMSARGQLVTANSNLVVHSHSHSQVSLQFLISKKDFNTWHVGPHQQFIVTMKPSTGKAVLLNLPLLRTQG
ncbi:MAG TPA: hypothetical protein VJX70_09865 [Candidatus Acidoferrum sp.]|nr:hypothetical protein [Candidatus Acidoferrum sp.]